MLTHLSLFSGIGGLDLAAEAAGFQTIGQCEWADYPTKVLEKHWPNVPRWRDIRTLTGDDFYAKTGYPVVDIISGGFPCQPFSVAGKRRGTSDDRFLWPEMLRVISEIRPAWVLGENVPGIINLALDQVLADLENQGYACQTFSVPACGVDAPHKRARICIVAFNTNRNVQASVGQIQKGCDESGRVCGLVSGADDVENAHGGGFSGAGIRAKQPRGAETLGAGEVVADTHQQGLQGRNRDGVQECASEWPAGPGGAHVSDADLVGRDTRRPESEGQQREARITDGGYDVSDTKGTECQRRRREAWGRRSELRCSGWWPAEPDVGRGFDGLSAIMDGIGGLSDAAKNRACEILCDVRESFTPEAVQRAFGGFQGISAEEILLAFLCEYEESCFRSGTPETSGTVPEGLLRDLWRTVESARASYRREYHSQLAREYSDALLRLPHGAPSLMPQAWANGTWEDGIERVTHGVKSRVDRLKCLGNAVVPQQFYPFFRFIADIERGLLPFEHP